MKADQLLQLMVKKGISDIHFKVGSAPLIRVNGRLLQTGMEMISPENIEELAYGFMTPEQKRQFETEHELDIAYSIASLSRFRINVYLQRGTIALSLRVVPLQVKGFDELHLPVATLQKLAGETRGLILIAGITGAGKTTTLNSLIDYLNSQYSYNIITVEDPIEYYHRDKKSSISQREVGSDTRSYARALTHALRQDPDIVVIGEMRDFEAVSAAITAAETGHLVLSTIHTLDAVQTIDRIIDSFPPHQQASVRSQLGNVLKGIVAQRLLNCKDGDELIPVTEVLTGTSLVRKLIQENKLPDVYKSMEQGSYYGMHTFDQAIFELYRQGRITIEEALDNATNADDLTLKLKGIERAQ
jgi:twitching motility protein PilT